MRLTVADVLNQLIAEGLAAPESVVRARSAFRGAEDPGVPWLARAIAGVGAWVATACLVGFLFVTRIVNDEVSAMILGGAVILGAVYLRRSAEPEEDFKRQLTLASSLAGQVLLLVGVAAETRSAVAAGLVAVATSLVLIALVPDQGHRFMSALVGSIGAIAAMADLKLAWTIATVPALGDVVVRGSDVAVLAIVAATAFVWRFKLADRSPQTAEMLEPVGYGTVAALFAVLLFSAVFAFAHDVVGASGGARANAWQLGPLTTLGIAGALVGLELSIFAEQRTERRAERRFLAVSATAGLALLTLSSPGVVAAVAVLVLGFDRRNRVLIGLAVAFLVKFTSAYYYSLHMTLLEKSVALVGSGLLLLTAWAYTIRRSAASEAEA